VQKKKRNRWTSCTAITTQSCLFLRGLASVGGSCPLSLVSFFFIRRWHCAGSRAVDLFVAGPSPLSLVPWLLVSFGVFGLFCYRVFCCVAWLLWVVHHWYLGCWSLLVLLVSFGVIGLFWCYWSLLLCGWASAGGLCPLSLVFFLFAFLWVVYAHYHWSLCCWSLSVLLVSFVLAHYLNPCRQTFPQT